jgi:sugar (pentulose or hexulose) kinase
MMATKNTQVPYLLAADIGTTATRVVLFDASGEVVAEARLSVQPEYPKPGRAELDAEIWWNTFCQATRQVLAGEKAEAVAGLAITHQRQSFVPVDHSMRPVRPAILWYDTRASSQAEWARKYVGVQRIYRRTGSPPGRRAVYKVMWLKEHEPNIFRRTYKILFIPDFLIYRLTGELVSSPGTSATSGCLDVAHPNLWAGDILDVLDISSDLWVTPIRPSGTVVGQVTRAGAEATGLVAGTPIVLAAGDQPCGNLGCGVVRPGMMGINGGTSCALETPTERLVLDEAISFFVDFSPVGYYVAENGITSGGAALFGWFRREFNPSSQVQQEDADIWEYIYEELVGQTSPGNLGLMLVPYLRGANGPYWDNRARGLLAGLRLDHGRAHLARALLEGLAYEARRIVESMEIASGTPIEDIRMYGGSSKSQQWNQIFADVLNRPVRVTHLEEPPALGAAIAAGTGVGFFTDMAEAARAMVQVRQVFEPRPMVAALYDRLYHEVYRHLYASLSELMARASDIIGYP